MPNTPDITHQADAVEIKRKGLRWLSTCCLLLVTGPVFAAPQNQVSESDYLEDIPVVLSPTRLAQPVTEAPAAVTVIDREMIEASGARQIADLFRLVPGFTVAYFNGYTPSVAYHGLADEYSRRMQVLIDGRSVYLPSIGGVPWNDLPLTIDDIDRIEVIRGSDSATYGSNSFLAVISITTRHASEDKGIQLRTAVGQHRVHDGTVRFGSGAQSLTYHMTVGYREDDGFNNRYDTQQTRLFNARVEYQMGMRDSLDTQFGISGGPRQSSYNNEPLDPHHSKGINMHFEQLRWRHVVSPAQEYSVQFYHTYHDTDEDYMTLPYDFGGGAVLQPLPFIGDITAERYDLEFQHTLIPGADTRLVWGASVRQDQVRAPMYFSTNATLRSNLQRLFANFEWHILPSLVTNAGAMLEHNDITGSTVSPRIAVNYHVTDHQTLRGVVATGTRAPTLWEDQGNLAIDGVVTGIGAIRNQEFLTHDSLHPERILSREIGYLFNWPERGTSFDIKFYNDSLHDLINSSKVCGESNTSTDVACRTQVFLSGIDTTPGDNNYQYFHNVNHAMENGLEFQLDQRVGTATRFIAGYAFIKIHGESGSQVRSAPKNNLHLMLIQKLPASLIGSLMYYQYGNMEYLGSGNHTDVQKRLDMRLARNFNYVSDKFQIALVVQNMMHSYQDFLYDARGPSKGPSNLFDTRAFIELKWDMP